MQKSRLDQELAKRRLTESRSQAEDVIRRGFVTVDGRIITKAGFMTSAAADIKIKPRASFVSRAGEKLYSVIKPLQLDFRNKTVLDVGSSTGGFSDLALQNGATKVIAVDVGTDQLHQSLRNDPKIELHEKTDIRDFKTDQAIDLVVIDVSFISLREILPYVSRLITQNTQLVVMVKPQFEAGDQYKHKGVIKNDSIRRNILKDFEIWIQKLFTTVKKADSEVAGAKGNRERFYLLKKL